MTLHYELSSNLFKNTYSQNHKDLTFGGVYNDYSESCEICVAFAATSSVVVPPSNSILWKRSNGTLASISCAVMQRGG